MVQQFSQDKFIECQLHVFGLGRWNEEHAEDGLCSFEGSILGGSSAKVLRSDVRGVERSVWNTNHGKVGWTGFFFF